MTRVGPLQWRSGGGWLVLGGGGNWRRGELGEMDGRALALADFSLPVAYLPTANGSIFEGEELLDYYADLGGPQGYVVPILSPSNARDPENVRLLSEAGLIYIGDGDALHLAQVLWESPALDGLARAFEIGAVIVGAGAGAAALGAWVLGETVGAAGGPGLGWVEQIVVVPYFAGTEGAPVLQAALRAYPGLNGVGIPAGFALALGPEAQLETWGDGDITFVVAR
ncbi:MAG: Type 1 glutamine amidotransferase-like domain-containing protein [Anaerolineae bacterium]|nr:Type 1 glutamine amidotransferase-like domain-containing protein [Anaerolineae bacterium]